MSLQTSLTENCISGLSKLRFKLLAAMLLGTFVSCCPSCSFSQSLFFSSRSAPGDVTVRCGSKSLPRICSTNYSTWRGSASMSYPWDVSLTVRSRILTSRSLSESWILHPVEVRTPAGGHAVVTMD